MRHATLCMFLWVLAFTIWFPQAVSAAVPPPDEILGEAAILMDAETGQVLYEKNAYESRQPASITKIMTGLLALEYLDPGSTVTASATAVDIPSWGSSAYIEAGERLTIEDALYAMMLKSANEAANVLAEAVSGSLDAFADLMNQRALELGAQGTHFVNANGLPARNHLTTAYDMALITRQAIRTTGFLDYFGAATHSMSATNKFGARVFTNTHRMLLPSYAVYNEAVIGGKTGYTVSSGYTLVTVAEQEGRTLICVILKSGSYYADTQALLDYGFDEFTAYTYTFDGNTPIEASVWNGDWEAGRAYFHPPEPVSFLLHDSVGPEDIVEEYAVPQRLEASGEISGDAVLRLKGGGEGLPEVLLALPMEAEVAVLDPRPTQTVTVIPESVEPVRPSGPGPFPVAVLLMAVSGGVCVVTAQVGEKSGFFKRRQRKRRRQRKALYLHHP